MLTIAHITDLHITTADDEQNYARHETRLRQVLDAIHAIQPRPGAIIASGDLVHRGDLDEYYELQRILKDSQIPVYLGVGNHDRRDVMRTAIPNTPNDGNGFVQYVSDVAGVRIVMADSLEEGKGHGAYCSRRAAWLQRTLDEASDVPTIVAIHHPPVRSGIQWMEDPEPGDGWVVRLADVLRGRPNIIGIIAGHLHRAFHAPFAGHIVSVTAATAIELTLNLTDIDRSKPDGRELLREEPPGFAILLWDKNRLTTHVCLAGEFPAAVHFTRPLGQH